MAALADESDRRLSGPEQVAWIARTAREQDNVRAALRWLVDAGELEPVSRVLVRLLRFWRMRGQMAEGRRWAEEVLALGADLPPVVRARALWRVALRSCKVMKRRRRSSARRRSWPGPMGIALWRDTVW